MAWIIRPYRLMFSIRLAMLPSCSSAGDDGGSSTPESAANPARQARDVCSLITEAEAEALLGADLIVTPGTSGGPPSCIYKANSRRLNGFTITVHWQGGREALGVVLGGMTIATTLAKTDEPDINSMMQLRPVEGVGDEAYFNPMAGTSVLKGDTLLEFDIHEMMWHRKLEEGLGVWKQLAEIALSRL